MLYDCNNCRDIDLKHLPHPLNKTTLYLHKKLKKTPQYILTLGSGLNDVFSDGKIIYVESFSKIPGIPTSTVSGHSGKLEIIEYENKTVAVLRGRLHTYEGYSPDDVVRLIRALSLLGAKTAIITNAAGSTHIDSIPGEFILLRDHINMTSLSPLSSDEARALGDIFVDMSEPYSLELRETILKIARDNGIKISEGVYAWVKGPQYETASEVKMLKALGADVVGMSTVPEVIALQQLGVKTVCISTITNYCTGIKKGSKLSHEEVKEMGKKVSATLDKLLKLVIKEI